MIIHDTFYDRHLRGAYVELLHKDRFPHALTLNTDRHLSEARLRSIFGTFCAQVDRRVHGKQRVRNIPGSLRFLAIAWPENLETNAHLHVAADLRPLARGVTISQLQTMVEPIWLSATRGSGSVHLRTASTSGWARYITKRADRIDPTYFISTDYHPH